MVTRLITATSTPNALGNPNESTATTSSWAGYASYGPTGSVMSISSIFVIPQITCASHADDSAVGVWAGIDDSNVEQAGVEAQCVNGLPQYWSFYEFYPQGPVPINNTLPVGPGQKISVTVTYWNSQFIILIQNQSTTKSVSIPYNPLSKPQLSSGECIVERLANNGGALPLANFGSATFQSCNIQNTKTSYTTAINLVNAEGQYLAQVVLGTPNNFVIIWDQSE